MAKMDKDVRRHQANESVGRYVSGQEIREIKGRLVRPFFLVQSITLIKLINVGANNHGAKKYYCFKLAFFTRRLAFFASE